MTRLLIVSLALVAACAPEPNDVTPDSSPDSEQPLEDAAGSALESIDLDGMTVGTDLEGAVAESIVSRDGGMELGLTDAVLFTRLSEATRKEVEDEMGQETEDMEGLGGQIARAVTGVVAEGLGTAVQVPLADIEDVRVEGNRLVIVMADGEPSPFETSKTNGQPLLESFDLEDAERLADAFERLR